MLGDETNSQAIQVLVNYWEVRPASMGARLDTLIRQGVTHVTSFVPWQAVESDISHSLTRFLQAASDRKMTVSLILSPEVGVHYPSSGLPKDILNKADTAAKHVESKPIPVHLPPNSFALPSLSAPEFAKRYHNFLSRIDTLLGDLARNQPEFLKRVNAVLTGSFWKYYRSPQYSTPDPFGGAAGDYSGSASVAYRQRLEQFFAQKEFGESSPSAANRWKTRAMEDVNRRWFYQQSEDVFRNRSAQFLRKRAAQLQVDQMELFTPEADPGASYSSFFQMLSGNRADFNRYCSFVEAASQRSSAMGGESTRPFIHWTSLGGFRTFSDSEKQFLILKSLLLMGGRRGGVLVDEAEWLSLSASFRSRAEALSRMLSYQHLGLKNRVNYFSPHLWSRPSALWDEVKDRIGSGARMISSLDLALREREASLLVVDPSTILTREAVHKFLAWARAGRIVAIPRSILFTDAARVELEQHLMADGGMEIHLGIPYRVVRMGEGKLVLYEVPESDSGRSELSAAWQTFANSLLSMAGVQPYCRFSDSRLNAIPLERKDGGMGFFIMNPTARSVSADLLFQGEVTVSDLSARFYSEKRSDDSGSVPASRFSLEVPPFGILPIAVDGLGADAEERIAAALTADILKANAMEAANGELPGFSANGSGIEAIWN